MDVFVFAYSVFAYGLNGMCRHVALYGHKLLGLHTDDIYVYKCIGSLYGIAAFWGFVVNRILHTHTHQRWRKTIAWQRHQQTGRP